MDDRASGELIQDVVSGKWWFYSPESPLPTPVPLTIPSNNAQVLAIVVFYIIAAISFSHLRKKMALFFLLAQLEGFQRGVGD